MKKNTIIAAIAAASALLLCASCQKQEIQEQNSGINAGGKVFTATIEQALTKTTITNEYKVNWVEGDKVSINGVEYTAVPDSKDPTKAALTPPAEGSAAPVDDKYYAVYPASIMVETVPTLPATQIYTAGQFNAPMYAESGTETFTFKNICGVLCLSLNGTDKVKSIAVTANEQICGPFEFIDAESFCFSGENEGYTVTLDCGEGVQLSSNSSTNFYVYLPPFDSYTAGLKIVVTNTEGKTFEKTTTTEVKIERNNIYTFNWTAAFAPVIPTGALPGEFSVSATKKVYFSQGNLVATIDATGAPTAWKFATNQYDFLGTGGANQTIGTAAGDVDLFGWSTEATTYGISTSEDDLDYLGDFVDWGTAIDNKGTWHTPSYDEWHYLLTTTARMEYGKPCYTIAKSGITIGETTYKGLFLYPDNYNGAEVSESMTWDEINAAGVVFIPAADSRDGKRVSTTRHGIWSSTTDSGDDVDIACKFYITDRVEGEEYDLRHYGFPVRLVSDVPAVTKGTAKATISSVETDVKWIQLWENGPKFAEYNVSSTRTFAIAKKTGADYIWGVNWRTPSKDELNELLLAAQGTSTKVTCVYGQNEEGVWGFNFTGKEAGYTCNSLFFPTDGNGNSDFGDGFYWSSTPGDAIGSNLYAFRLWLCNSYNDMTDSALESAFSGTGSIYTVKYAIRPVLAE